MPTARPNWAVLIAAGALVLSLTSNVLNVVSGGTDKLDKRLSKVEDDLAYKFATRDLLTKDINLVDRALGELKNGKVERDVYEQKQASIDRQIGLLREHVKEVDRSVNQTFSAKDALVTLQARIVELERQIRSPSGSGK